MRPPYLFVAILLFGILAGCGLKGDLFLPPESVEEPVVEEPVTGDPAADDEEEPKDPENDDENQDG